MTPEEIRDPLRALRKTGAQKLIKQTIDAEVSKLLSEYAGRKTERGHAGLVLNGTPPERSIQTGIGPVSVKIPKVRSRLGEAVHEIWMSDTQAYDLFVKTDEDKYPKATQCLQKDREELLASYDFPAQHWQSIRTSHPIESSFGTIRHRTKRSKGCLSRDGMLHMIFKLSQCAEKNWRKLRGFDSLGKVIEGVQFKDGIEIKKTEKPAQIAA